MTAATVTSLALWLRATVLAGWIWLPARDRALAGGPRRAAAVASSCSPRWCCWSGSSAVLAAHRRSP